jgi:hypothetical protein
MATSIQARAAKKFASTRAGAEITKIGKRLEGARAEFGTETGRVAKEYGAQITEYERKAESYQGEFSEYKNRYNQALAVYQQQVNEFNSRAAAFNQKTLVGGSFFQGYSGTGPIGMYRSGIKVTDPIYQVLLEAGTSPVIDDEYGEEVRGLGNKPTNPMYTLDVLQYLPYGYQYGLYRRGGTDPGEFNVSFNQPTVPTFNEPVPVMEDITPYSQKLKEETTYFEREIGERKLAKTAAARRLQTRPLLSEG